MQDVQLGVIIALLPAFGENDGDNSRDVIWKSFKILLETIASFIVVLGKFSSTGGLLSDAVIALLTKSLTSYFRGLFHFCEISGFTFISNSSQFFKRN